MGGGGVRRRNTEPDPMPEHLTRFVPDEWSVPDDELATMKPEYRDLHRMCIARRLYRNARMAWFRAHGGGSLLEELRGEMSDLRAMREAAWSAAETQQITS